MASYQIPPPPQMQCKGNAETNWLNFEEAWNDYCIATELDKKDAKIQAATLKTVMDRDCCTVLTGLKLSTEEMKDIIKILSSLKEHFVMKRNVLYERYIFHTAEQQPQETVTQFVDRLRKLAATCKFGEQRLENEMIQDRLVMGCRDQGARARLFWEDECTLQKALDTLKISEATIQQLKVITGGEYVQQQELNFAKNKQGRQSKNPRKGKDDWKKKQQREQQPPLEGSACLYCGGKHKRGMRNCPAYGKECSRCIKKINHFAKACKARIETVHAGDQESDTDDTDESNFSLEHVGSLNEKKGRKIVVPIMMKTQKHVQKVMCQVDTGATCNVMSYRKLCKLEKGDKPCMHPSATRIKLYDGNYIPVKGETDLICSFEGSSYNINFKIVETSSEMPLLSGQSSIQMGMIRISGEVETVHLTQSRDLIAEYNDVFEGLGCLPGDYSLTLDNNVMPVKHVACKVPINVKQELKDKLTDLEHRGIIPKVTQPTDWISSMVVVRKPQKMRICLDPRDLNRALKRPHYPIPVINDILPNLSKAKVFTVLDAKDGFWQVKLQDASSYLTTFATPFGRYR
ncbi:uncharacterized protein [Diadema setosum]|uniref:uncharacterized protein n=1 Tax=Diadema setosum TaxID=31175 RepID=UPI003B3AA7F3